MSNQFYIIEDASGESFDVYLNGTHIINANHDKNGWAGMEDVTEIINKIAPLIGATIEHTMESSE